MQVGWIGLGQMGEPMALQVVKAGRALVGHVRRPEEREALRGAGATLTSSAQEVAAQADILCVCVFDDAQLQAALVDSGALAALRPGAVVAIHSTGAPGVVEALARQAPAGVRVLDAPFSGTAEVAGRGGLTLFVGGEPEALEAARPVLSAFSGTIFRVGGVGAGRRLKLLNNLLFAAQVALSSEALEAARAMGLDPAVFVEAVGRSSGASYALDKFAPDLPVDAIMAGLKSYLDKDVDAARSAARDEGLDLPRLFAAADHWRLA